ncbi:M14 family metallopeptidase [Prauserella flavalba]|uniref:Zinc carboxypeptidase n=1 Tax=Prauserella flavalba TaxID=1477506 RepID=A0A318M4Y6_9PSEU|nr:M14 family metallopeptidase [Prauserella flavalba]PXY28528.1 carboxypeptidase [Prauserella flavalba]
MGSTRRVPAVLTGLVLLLTATAPATAGESAGSVYEVDTANAAQRTEIAATGVDVLGVRDGTLTFVAGPEQARELRADGFRLQRVGEAPTRVTDAAAPADFPSGDEGYHTYAEVTAELEQATRDHGDITRLSSAGESFEGRPLHVLKISDNAAADEDEPEVLFTCNQHAREHLTTEMCLRIVQRFTDGYGSDATVTGFVDSREIYVIPTVNPDGAEYDISGGQYQGWRKNRQGQGTDVNRNWGHRWGCCGGSSDDSADETFRGTEAFSSLEARAVASFVDSRVVGGAQQITAHIDFHTYSELVLWPYGYTTDDTAEGMSPEQAKRFSDVGTELANSNGYTPQQSSDLYVTDGSINDWMWGEHRILSFTFEMYPADGNGLDGFYPPDEQIGPQTARNDGAVDILLREAGEPG